MLRSSRRRPASLRKALLALIGAAGLAAPAHADPKDQELAEARVHFDKGTRLYDLRRYQEAIAEFETSYSQSGAPVLLYDIAQAHRMLGRYADAVHYYELYLKREPTSPRRPEIEKRIAELKQASQPPNQVDDPRRPAATPTTSAAPPVETPTQLPPSAGPPMVPAAPAAYGYPAYPPPGAAAPPPPVVQAPAATAAPEEHAHKGFLARGMLGFGYLSFASKNGADDVQLSGTAAALTVDLGWSLAPQFALFGEIFVASATNPSKNEGGAKSDLSGDLSTTGFGVGASYYLQPLNAFLSASLLASQGSVETKEGGTTKKDDTKVGAGLVLSAGKEWWVGRDLGLGAALQLHAASMKDSDVKDAPTWTAVAAAVAFTITYN